MEGVAYAEEYPFNAVFRRDSQDTVYGPGMATLDVVTHEWTHGVTQNDAGLEYWHLSGAVNESISDVMAAAIDNNNWTIGEGSATGILRDLADPGQYGQPAHTDELVVTCGDSGGVHTNSGVPNHAYYLMAQDLGRAEASHVFYRAVNFYLTEESGFDELEDALMHSASERFGLSAPEKIDSVRDALDSVGLTESWRDPGLRCLCGIKIGLTDTSASEDKLATYHRAREELLPTSDAGNLLVDLYEGNTDRIGAAFLEDPELREQAGDAFARFTPGMDALMDGRGDQLEVSQTDVDALDDLLSGLVAADDDRAASWRYSYSSSLEAYVEAGLRDLHPQNSTSEGALQGFVGLTYEDAWARLASLLCDGTLYNCAATEDHRAPAVQGTNTLVPSGDSSPDQGASWSTVGAESSTLPWPALNEAVFEPAIPDQSDYIQASRPNAWTRVSLGYSVPRFPQNAAIENGTLWYYGSTGPMGRLEAQLSALETPVVTQVLEPNSPPSWRSITLTPAVASRLGSLQIRFISNPGTERVRPNDDKAWDWVGDGGFGAAWAYLDDPVIQPAPPYEGDLIYSTAQNQVTRVALGTGTLPPHHVSGSDARLWVYANTNANTKLEINAYWGGVLRGTRTIQKGETFGWRSLEIPLPTQAALNDIEVRFKTLEGGKSKVRAAYMEVPLPTGTARVDALYYQVDMR